MEKLKKYVNAVKALLWGGGQKRKYLICALLGAVLALLAQCAVATESITLPPKPVDQSVRATANSDSSSSSQASSSSGGNSLSVNEARQAPSLAQGGLYLAGCGFSGNAGDSNSRGASFLGIQFITPGCWDQMAIQNEARMGNIKTACEMNRLTRQGQRNLKRLRAAGLEPEPCPGPVVQPVPQPVPQPVQQPTVVVLESCDNRERTDRVFAKCMEK